MLDTGKDAIDVTATVTGHVGEKVVELNAKGIKGLLQLLLKIIQKALEKAIEKRLNGPGKKKIGILQRNGDPITYMKIPKKDLKQFKKQSKALGFQYSLSKSGNEYTISYKAKDVEVVSLALENIRDGILNKGKDNAAEKQRDLDIQIAQETEKSGSVPEMAAHAERSEKDAQAINMDSHEATAQPKYEPIKVTRDQNGNFVYSRGDISMISKDEKGYVVRQRLMDTFGIGEKGAWAVWNQGLDLSKNDNVANRPRRSVNENIKAAVEKQEAALFSKQNNTQDKTKTAQKTMPATAGAAR